MSLEPPIIAALAGWLMVRAGAGTRMIVLRAPSRCAADDAGAATAASARARTER